MISALILSMLLPIAAAEFRCATPCPYGRVAPAANLLTTASVAKSSATPVPLPLEKVLERPRHRHLRPAPAISRPHKGGPEPHASHTGVSPLTLQSTLSLNPVVADSCFVNPAPSFSATIRCSWSVNCLLRNAATSTPMIPIGCLSGQPMSGLA